jgi:hypothetical protein
MNAVKENTNYLETIVDLQRQKQSLESALNVSQAILTSDISGPNQKDLKEKEKLVTLVQNQAVQIEAIKAEIENLIRKPTSKTYVRVLVDASKQRESKLPPIPKKEGGLPALSAAAELGNAI